MLPNECTRVRQKHMQDEYKITTGGSEHHDAMVALLPLLASFELPRDRVAEHLWHGDRDMISAWARGSKPECFARVALAREGALLGFAFVSMREEMMSHAPSAHLEVLVVAQTARRLGLGATLSNAAEAEAAARGAQSITLHVFGNNKRARSLYSKLGYDEEILRCTKRLE